MDEEDELHFWQQSSPIDSTVFISSIWKGMKKIFRGQIRLRR